MEGLASNQAGYRAIPQGDQPIPFNYVHQEHAFPRKTSTIVTIVAVAVLAIVGVNYISHRSDVRGLFQNAMPFEKPSFSYEMRPSFNEYPGSAYTESGIEEAQGNYWQPRDNLSWPQDHGSSNEPWCRYVLSKLTNGVRFECACKYSNGFTLLSNSDDRDRLMNCFNPRVQNFCGKVPLMGLKWLKATMWSTARACCARIHGNLTVGKYAQCY